MNINVLRDKKEMVTELLNNFGEYHNPYLDSVNSQEEAFVSHRGFGLELKKYVRSGYIVIKYEDKTVLDEINNMYLPGIWEEILKDYCIKIPVITLRRDNCRQKINRCEEVLRIVNYLLDISDSYVEEYTDSKKEILIVNNSMIITRKSSRDIYNLSNKSIKVFYDDQEVFGCDVNEKWSQCGFPVEEKTFISYTKGDWEQLIYDAIKESNKKKAVYFKMV